MSKMIYVAETYNYWQERPMLKRLEKEFSPDFIVTNPGVMVRQIFALPWRHLWLRKELPMSRPEFYRLLFQRGAESICRIFPFYTEVPPALVRDFIAQTDKKPVDFSVLKGEDIALPFIIERLFPGAVTVAENEEYFHVSGMQTNAIEDPYTHNRVWIDQAWRRFYMGTHFDKYFSVPKALVLEISNACNLKCVKCPYFSPDASIVPNSAWAARAKIMDYDTARQVLEQWEHTSPKPTLYLSGDGEPLVNKKFRQMVTDAIEMGYAVSVTTNGTLLDDSAIDFLVDNKVGAVISLDATTPETFQKVVPGESFEGLKDNIERLLVRNNAAGLPPVSLAFLEMQGKNGHEWEDFASEWMDKGATVKRIIEVPLTDRAAFKTNDIPLPEQILACTQPFVSLRLTTDGMTLPCCAEKVDKYSWEWSNEAQAESAWEQTLHGFRESLLSDEGKAEMCSEIECNIWRGNHRHIYARGDTEYSLYEVTEERRQLTPHPEYKL